MRFSRYWKFSITQRTYVMAFGDFHPQLKEQQRDASSDPRLISTITLSSSQLPSSATLGFSVKTLRMKSPSSPGLKVLGMMT